ncbi:MAG TPA: UDP-glucose/GDP-mannose dehydrogenase family protein [Candidatus Eisenbacteria bacterium]|nr:UDP-glucose/GDP-mannose dehydrogenase family protein [Candidatus Eisenbacteria bacterium]
MTITFLGHGYVGLVTAAVFADLGNTVWVIGHTKEKIENLKKGILPIYEPGLEELVMRNVKAGRLLFTLDYAPAIPESDVVFIAVGTPPKPTGEADLSVVFEVAEEIGKHLNGYTVVITKSTVPVGTNKKVGAIIEKVKPAKAEFDIASCPEFLREGQAIGDTQHPDRVVIGADNKKAADKLVELHKPILEGNGKSKLVLTNISTAEMIKYASNAFLATKISFANAIAQLSEKVGADGPDVLSAIGLDKRIGTYFLNAGAGYGGSCFPKDVKALIAIADENGYDFKLLKDVEEINKEAMHSIAGKVKKLLGEVKGKRVGVLGLTFKPDTDDMRDAPSRTVIPQLLKEGAMVKAFDPIATQAHKAFPELKGLEMAKDAYDAAKDADVLVVMTEWNEFKQLDVKKLKSLMKTPLMVDGRNIYETDYMRSLGFTYVGVGR